MAETDLNAREIYVLIEACIAMFAGKTGKTEGDQAVIDLVVRNFDMISAAMLIMLAENRPRSDREP